MQIEPIGASDSILSLHLALITAKVLFSFYLFNIRITSSVTMSTCGADLHRPDPIIAPVRMCFSTANIRANCNNILTAYPDGALVIARMSALTI